jgi:hypothetical protein
MVLNAGNVVFDTIGRDVRVASSGSRPPLAAQIARCRGDCRDSHGTGDRVPSFRNKSMIRDWRRSLKLRLALRVAALYIAATVVVIGMLMSRAYDTARFLTNPVFYVKLCLIALAVWLLHRIGVVVLRAADVEGGVVTLQAKRLAIVSLLSWVALITAGRLLAYTHKWEMLGIPSII